MLKCAGLLKGFVVVLLLGACQNTGLGSAESPTASPDPTPTTYATYPPSPLPTPTPVPTPIPSLKPCESPADYLARPLQLADTHFLAVSDNGQRIYLVSPAREDYLLNERQRQGVWVWEGGKLSPFQYQGQSFSTCDKLWELEKDDSERLYMIRQHLRPETGPNFRVQQIVRFDAEKMDTLLEREDGYNIRYPAYMPQPPVEPNGFERLHLPSQATGEYVYYRNNEGEIYNDYRSRRSVLCLNTRTQAQYGLPEFEFPMAASKEQFAYFSVFFALNIPYTQPDLLEKQQHDFYLDEETRPARFSAVVMRIPHNSNYIYYMSVSRIWRADLSKRELMPWVGSADTGNQDGLLSAARFQDLRAMSLDQANNLYVLDAGNRSVRKITPEGQVSTLFQTP